MEENIVGATHFEPLWGSKTRDFFMNRVVNGVKIKGLKGQVDAIKRTDMGKPFSEEEICTTMMVCAHDEASGPNGIPGVIKTV